MDEKTAGAAAIEDRAFFARLPPFDIKALDFALWLPGAFSSGPFLETWYCRAAEIGRERAAFFKTALGRPYREAVLSAGVRAVRTFAETGEDAEKAHSYYVPESREIEYDQSFSGLIQEAEKDLGLDWFSPEETEECLIIHEFFHHDECVRKAETDRILKKEFGKRAPEIFRDIAAFAFTNALLEGIPCQALDLLWLYCRRPTQCRAVLEQYNNLA